MIVVHYDDSPDASHACQVRCWGTRLALANTARAALIPCDPSISAQSTGKRIFGLTSDRLAKRMYMTQTTPAAVARSVTSLLRRSSTSLPRASRSSINFCVSDISSPVMSTSSLPELPLISGPLAVSTSAAILTLSLSMSSLR